MTTHALYAIWPGTDNVRNLIFFLYFFYNIWNDVILLYYITEVGVYFL